MLLYDLTATQPIGDIARHGGGIYGEMVLFNLVKKSSNFACYYDSKRWINPRIIEECNKSNIKIYDINDVSLEDLSKRFTHIYSALPNISTQKVPIHKIFTLHGLRDLETPLDSFIPYYTRSWKNKLKYYIKLLCKAKFKKRSLARIKDIYLYDKKNVEIITVSNHSRAAIEILIPEICNYKIPIKTFYSPEISQDSSHEIVNYPKHTSNCNFPFFLIVSGNRWIKNSVRALIAFDELVEEGLIKNTIFKVAGATKEDIDYKFKNVDKIEFLGYIDDRELNQLYRDASLLVYPSLNEGFGYPPLTAMKLLTPVIASCFTSIPEICGDGAMYFNPLSITEIKNRMLQMQDEKIKEIYINKGKIQFEKIVERQKIDLNAMTDYLLSYEKK